MQWLAHHQLKSRNPAVRQRAIEQLCRAPTHRAFNSLRLALNDENTEVRRLAAVALGKLAEDRCREPLLQALRDRDSEVIKSAVVALKQVPEPERSFPTLAGLLRHADAGVRGHAAQALEHLGWQPAHPEEQIWLLMAEGQLERAAAFGPAAIPALETALMSQASSVAVGAVRALAEIGDTRVVRPLSRALKLGDPAVCVAVVDALQRLGDPEAVQQMLHVLRHANPQVRAATVEALGRMRAPAALDPIRALLADPVWEVRREAAEALGRLGDRRAIEALSGALADADDDVRETTALVLGNLGDRTAIHALVLALQDTTSGVRRIAAAALSRIDPDWTASPEAQPAIQELKAALQHGDSNVRHFVGQLLVNLGAVEPAAVPHPEGQDWLASSPAKRRKLAVTLFAAVLCDPDRDLRQAAAEALGDLGDPRAQSALLKAHADADAGVRTAAAAALQALSAASAP